MQILGVAGRSDAGKTTLCRAVAAQTIDDGYGLPVPLSFTNDTAVMEAEFITYLEKEPTLVKGRTEYFLLIDNISSMDQIALIRKWNGTTVFIDAGRRLIGKPSIPSDSLANLYTGGILPEELFDWHITNYNGLADFHADIARYKAAWLGGCIEH